MAQLNADPLGRVEQHTSTWIEVAIWGFVVLLGLWFLNSNANPLWKIIEQWPRTLDRQELFAKFDGMIRFGMPGASLIFQETSSGDRISFIKTSPTGESRLVLAIESQSTHSDLRDSIEQHAQLALGRGHQLCPSAEPNSYEVQCDDPAVLVGLLRKLAELLAHDPTARYRARSKGPSDWNEVREYFGIGGPAA